MKKLLLAAALSLGLSAPAIALQPIQFDPAVHKCHFLYSEMVFRLQSPPMNSHVSLKHDLRGEEASNFIYKINTQYNTDFPLVDTVMIWTSSALPTDLFTFGFMDANCVMYSQEIPAEVINSLFQTL